MTQNFQTQKALTHPVFYSLVYLLLVLKQLSHAQHKIYSEKVISSDFDDSSSYFFLVINLPILFQLQYFTSSSIVSGNWRLNYLLIQVINFIFIRSSGLPTSKSCYSNHLNPISIWMNVGIKANENFICKSSALQST